MKSRSEIANCAEKEICDLLWKIKGVRGDAEWPREAIREIIESALQEYVQRNPK